MRVIHSSEQSLFGRVKFAIKQVQTAGNTKRASLYVVRRKAAVGSTQQTTYTLGKKIF